MPKNFRASREKVEGGFIIFKKSPKNDSGGFIMGGLLLTPRYQRLFCPKTPPLLLDLALNKGGGFGGFGGIWGRFQLTPGYIVRDLSNSSCQFIELSEGFQRAAGAKFFELSRLLKGSF